MISVEQLEQFGKDNMFKSLVGLPNRFAEAFPEHKTKYCLCPDTNHVRLTVQQGEEPATGDLTLEMMADLTFNRLVAIPPN